MIPMSSSSRMAPRSETLLLAHGVTPMTRGAPINRRAAVGVEIVRSAALPQIGLQLAKRHLDRIQVGRIFAQVAKCRAARFDLARSAASGRPWSPHGVARSRQGTSCRFPDCVSGGYVGLRACQASDVQRASRKPNVRLTKRLQSTATCPNCSGKSCRHISSRCRTCRTECLRF